ncbi:MAG TPA: SAM-dependent methyltransferase [Polyangiaceae bacterium]|nr:SAM-dependent methyltransferase [Polyangiaceae bacterium]
MGDSAIHHVSDTAFMVAHCRALESQRRDALFHDPLAARLAGDRGKAIIEAFPTARMTTWMVAIRTVVIDELIRALLPRGIDTVLNLGAGLDTRPYRLDVPKDLNWVEVDYPHVIEFKRERLQREQPRCQLRQVGLDLADSRALQEFLAEANGRAKRLLVLTEGVVPYLDVGQVGLLADDLRALTRLDSWIVDYLSKESHRHRERAGVTRHMRQAPFKFQPDDWFAFFAEHGFKVGQLRYLAERGDELGRHAPLPLRYRLLISLLRRLTPPSKRGGFQKFAGYAVLEPERSVN